MQPKPTDIRDNLLNSSVGRIEGARVDLSLLDIRRHTSAGFFGRIFTDLSLLFRGKGWVSNNRIERLLRNMDLRTLSQLNEFVQASADPAYENLKIRINRILGDRENRISSISQSYHFSTIGSDLADDFTPIISPFDDDSTTSTDTDSEWRLGPASSSSSSPVDMGGRGSIHTVIPPHLSGGMTEAKTRIERKIMEESIREHLTTIRRTLIEQIPPSRLDLTKPVGEIGKFFDNNNYLISLQSNPDEWSYDPVNRLLTVGGKQVPIDTEGLHVTETFINPSVVETEINCDDGVAVTTESSRFAILSFNDGNGWGGRSRRAAVNTNRIVTDFLRQELEQLASRGSVTHRQIIEAHDRALFLAAEELSRTTVTADIDPHLMTGTTCPQVLTVAGNYVHLSSIGDSKAFIISADLDTIREPSEGNRGGVDPTDPGGRIGEEVDARNYFHSLTMLNPGDSVIVCSDGIHDNLDPETLGLTPRDVNSALDTDHWDDNNPAHQAERNTFMRTKLQQVLKEYKTEKGIHGPLSSEQINEALNSFVQRTTLMHKIWMIEHPTERVPEGHELIGKLDHAGMIVYQHPV